MDLWDVWDDRVKRVGRVSRAAQDLSDAELVRLLATETSGRQVERRILSEEAYARIHRQTLVNQGERPSWPKLGREAGP